MGLTNKIEHTFFVRFETKKFRWFLLRPIKRKKTQEPNEPAQITNDNYFEQEKKNWAEKMKRICSVCGMW